MAERLKAAPLRALSVGSSTQSEPSRGATSDTSTGLAVARLSGSATRSRCASSCPPEGPRRRCIPTCRAHELSRHRTEEPLTQKIGQQTNGERQGRMGKGKLREARRYPDCQWSRRVSNRCSCRVANQRSPAVVFISITTRPTSNAPRSSGQHGQHIEGRTSRAAATPTRPGRINLAECLTLLLRF